MKFQDGSTYRGGFVNGQFNGDGELIFAEGKIIGTWENGRMLQYRIIFKDDLEFQEQRWDYITPQDRRYFNEVMGRVPNAASRERPEDFQTEAQMKSDGK